MDVRQMPLDDLIDACRAETERYRRGEPVAGVVCWELIRRAICERSDPAWAAFVEQYRRLVLTWVRRLPAAEGADVEDDEWVTLTFASFWESVGPVRFADFASLDALLAYLKKCVFSVVIDEARARARRARLEPLSDEPDGNHETAPPAIDDIIFQELCKALLAEARTPAERIVARLCFILDYKPAEVQALRPAVFPTVQDVYRTVRNLKERLKRDSDIGRFLGE